MVEEKSRKLVLVPLFSLQGPHWTLLAFRMDLLQVRYYETRTVPCKGNLKAAQKVVGLVD